MRTLLLLLLAAPAWSGELAGPPAPEPAAVRLDVIEVDLRKELAYDLAWMGGAAAFDYATKRAALNSCSECYEANPLFRAEDGSFQSTKAIAAKVLVTGGATFACYKLRKAGHHKAAKVTRVVIVAAWVAAGFVNAYHAK